MTIRKFGMVALMMFPLAACAGDGNDVSIPSESALIGSQWIVDSIEGAPLAPTGSNTLMFDKDRRVSGHAGCNEYWGPVEITASNVKIGPLKSTQVACAELHGGAGVSVQADTYLDLLQRADHAERQGDGKLSMTTVEGLTLSFAPSGE